MEKEDSFPQRVWQIVAAIPKAMSPLTVMWRNWQDRPAPRARWAVCYSVSPKAAPYPGTGWLIATAQFR